MNIKENEIFNLAYHFEYEDTRTDVVISLHNKIQSQIALWKSKTYSLYHQIIELGLVSISDNRNTEHFNEYVLTAPESLLYTEIVFHPRKMCGISVLLYANPESSRNYTSIVLYFVNICYYITHTKVRRVSGLVMRVSGLLRRVSGFVWG